MHKSSLVSKSLISYFLDCDITGFPSYRLYISQLMQEYVLKLITSPLEVNVLLLSNLIKAINFRKIINFLIFPESRLLHMSHDMGCPTMWYVLPAKAQTSLRIHTVWSEPLLVTWIFYEYWATDRTSFGVCKLKRRLHMLIWLYTCQNATLLEITCHGSIIMLD